MGHLALMAVATFLGAVVSGLAGLRHLPITEQGKIKDVISMRDVTEWIIQRQQEQFDSAINAIKTMAASNRRPALNTLIGGFL